MKESTRLVVDEGMGGSAVLLDDEKQVRVEDGRQ